MANNQVFSDVFEKYSTGDVLPDDDKFNNNNKSRANSKPNRDSKSIIKLDKMLKTITKSEKSFKKKVKDVKNKEVKINKKKKIPNFFYNGLSYIPPIIYNNISRNKKMDKDLLYKKMIEKKKELDREFKRILPDILFIDKIIDNPYFNLFTIFSNIFMDNNLYVDNNIKEIKYENKNKVEKLKPKPKHTELTNLFTSNLQTNVVRTNIDDNIENIDENIILKPKSKHIEDIRNIMLESLNNSDDKDDKDEKSFEKPFEIQLD